MSSNKVPQGRISGLAESLEKKQDKFLAQEPLAFISSANTWLKECTYDSASTVATFSDYGFSWYNYYGEGIRPYADGSMNSSGHLTVARFCDFPYSFCNIVEFYNDSNSANSYEHVMYGYYEQGSFIPVILSGACPLGVNSNTNSYHPGVLLTGVFTRYGTRHYSYYAPSASTVSGTFATTASSRVHSQLFYDESQGCYAVHLVKNATKQMISFPPEYNDLISKINAVRYTPRNSGAKAAYLLVKDYSTPAFITELSTEEYTALPNKIQPIDASEHLTLVTKVSSQSYNDLDNIPTVNNIPIEGDMSLADLNVQRVLTPTAPLKVSQHSDWVLLDGTSYDDVNKKVVFASQRGSYPNTTETMAQFYTDTVGDVDSTAKSFVPKRLLIPFYKNVTFILNMEARPLIGYYDGTNFTPYFLINAAIGTKLSNSTSYSDQAILVKVSSVSKSTYVTVSGATYSSTRIDYTTDLPPLYFVSIAYENGLYTFKKPGYYQNASSKLVTGGMKLSYTPDESVTDLLNQCNYIWFPGWETNSAAEEYGFGENYNNRLIAGDVSEQIYAGDLDIYNYTNYILPDTNNADYYTSVSLQYNEDTLEVVDNKLSVKADAIPAATVDTLGVVKPDGTSLTIAEDGTLSASTSLQSSDTIEIGEDSATAIGMKTKSDTLLYDWVGTQEEYLAAKEAGTIQDNWVCWITDDDGALFDEYANLKLNNLDADGQAVLDSKLDHSQITNCILESPHMVDMTLSNGTATLKAGSKVIIPYGTSAPTMAIGDTLSGGTIVDISWDGSKLFYIVEATTDLTNLGTGAANTFYFALDPSGQVTNNVVSLSTSGASPTVSNYSFVYNTETNIIYTYGSDTSTPTGAYLSFPFAIGTTVASGEEFIWSTFNQVFQHIGYIGGAIWAMKGIKCLCPNGRNTDSTLNNIEYESPYVFTVQRTHTGDNKPLIMFQSGSISYSGGDIFYDAESNKILDSLGTVFEPCAFIGRVSVGGNSSATKVSSLTSKFPFEALDTNSTEFIANQAMPSGKYKDLTLGTSGSTYTAPADGYLYLAKGSSSDQYVQFNSTDSSLGNITGLLVGGGDAVSTAYAFMPMAKGQTTYVFYNASGAVLLFRFVYAKGAK